VTCWFRGDEVLPVDGTVGSNAGNFRPVILLARIGERRSKQLYRHCEDGFSRSRAGMQRKSKWSPGPGSKLWVPRFLMLTVWLFPLPELRVEALAVAVFPGTAGHDVGGLGADGGDSFTLGFGDLSVSKTKPGDPGNPCQGRFICFGRRTGEASLEALRFLSLIIALHQPAKLRQKDRDARWTVNFSKARVAGDGKTQQRGIAIPAFGYKNHPAIDHLDGRIRGWNVTSASA